MTETWRTNTNDVLSAGLMLRCNYGFVKLQPVRAVNRVFTLVLSGLALALFLPTTERPQAQNSTLENTLKQNRSGFAYHDGHAPERRPYRQPKLDVDPTDLSMEELRARLNHLEERLEQLEQGLVSSKGARR